MTVKVTLVILKILISKLISCSVEMKKHAFKEKNTVSIIVELEVHFTIIINNYVIILKGRI